MHRDAGAGDLAKVKAFIQEGVGINARVGGGRIPLPYGQKQGHAEIVELLSKHGAGE